MTKRSTTVTSAIAIVAATLVAMVGIPIGESEILELIEGIVKIVALIIDMVAAFIIWKDRRKKGDLALFGKRITPPKP